MKNFSSLSPEIIYNEILKNNEDCAKHIKSISISSSTKHSSSLFVHFFDNIENDVTNTSLIFDSHIERPTTDIANDIIQEYQQLKS